MGLRPSSQEKEKVCAWLLPLQAQGFKDAQYLLTLLSPLPSLEDILSKPFPMQYLDEIAILRKKAGRKLIRMRNTGVLEQSAATTALEQDKELNTDTESCAEPN
jgi:hypothetical protein